MDVTVNGIDIPDAGICLTLRFTDKEHVKLNCIFDARLQSLVGIIGPKLKAAVQVAIDEAGEEMKEKGIIAEDEQ